ncbi:NupC/NupG family nucleoside CNT transporter [Veronia pacifica]|uniref:Nucleoside permease n=1 Tax=Veronia pacifica TaxID=1080227 RepID=A0A1C3E7G2_9GAMM|nr:NupC/NupG family nucleoside CNT transporter [Veronia pacifica]ODA29163.1 transporter [Veronia pacifica]
MSSLLGIPAILFMAWLLSTDRKNIPFRMVTTALAIQVVFALLVLYVPAGKAALDAVTRGVSSVVSYGQQGINFLFGGIAEGNVGFVFAVNVLGIIIFFSALISALYHLGIMPRVISIIGGGLQRFLGTGKAESMSATANIFVGMTEAPLVIKPYLKTMSDSQLFAVMSCGLASVAGGPLVGYAAMGIDLKYLIAAAFMSAPAGLLMAKIIVPPSAEDAHSSAEQDVEMPVATNVIEAIADGAIAGMRLVAVIGATLLAFIGVIALVNGLLASLGDLVGLSLSLEKIFGMLFAPIAFLIGIPWNEAATAGSLLGNKLVMNEFVAFVQFLNVKDQLSEHSQAIVTFALCGFANISSLALLVGSMGTLAPERRSFVSRLGLRAIAAGVLANLMSAAIVGIILSFI